MDNHRVRVEFAVHDMGSFPVGYGIKNDREIIIRRIQLRGWNQELQAVMAYGQLLSPQLDDDVALVIRRPVYDRVLFVRKQEDAVAHGETFKAAFLPYGAALKARGGNGHRAARLFRPHTVAWTVRSQAQMDELKARAETRLDAAAQKIVERIVNGS